MANSSNKSLNEAANEAVKLQLEHPSAKQDRLLDLLSGGTSAAQGGGSMSEQPRSPTKEALISVMMKDFKMTRAEAIEELTLSGGL